MTTGLAMDWKGEAMSLREQVTGGVYLPGDEGYEGARFCWNVVIQQMPALIVDAAGVADVQAAIRFANANDLKVAVVATGHGMPRGCEGGLLIRVSRMKEITIDPATRMAWVGGGTQFWDLIPAAAAHGLAPLSGSSPDVGVVGYTLGGGYGLMVRQYGLAIDMVKSAQIVTADGEVVRASATENPDLFWAIRGGGGAFGVVTELEMELVPTATVYGGATFYAAEDVDVLFEAYAKWTQNLPENVSSCAQLMNLPPAPFIPEPLRGRTVVNINACVCGDLANAEEIVRPMRELAPAILDMWGEFPYTETAQIYSDPVDPMPFMGRGALLNEFTADTVRDMLAANGPAERSPFVAVQIRHLGGAMARVPHDHTPIGCRREANYLCFTLAVPHPMAPPEAILAHQDRLMEALTPYTLCPGPLNFLGEGDLKASHFQALFGAKEHARLQEIKSARDPHNLFCYASVGIKD